MRPDKLTSKFQLALSDAQSLAVARDNQFIEPAHLLVALLDQQGGTVRPLLDKAGVNLNQLRSRLGQSLERIARVEGSAGEVHVSNDLSRLLNLTEKLATQRGDQFIASELFILAAVDDKGELGKLLRTAAPCAARSRRRSRRSGAARRSTMRTPRRRAVRSRSTRST